MSSVGEYDAGHVLDLAEPHVRARFATIIVRRVRFALYDVDAAVAPALIVHRAPLASGGLMSPSP